MTTKKEQDAIDKNRAEAKAQAVKEAATAAAAQAKEEKPAPFTIAPGKSLVCKRGILGPGEAITEKDAPAAVIAKFVKSGHIIEA